MSFQVKQAGGAALAALHGGPAKVFASFERSCYVETPAGVACLGAGIGLGPLNAIVEDFDVFPVGDSLFIDIAEARRWQPAVPLKMKRIPVIDIPASIRKSAQQFLAWLRNEGAAPDELIGLGPGLTPAGDDFVGGAMIALRAFGNLECADRIAAWALPLAKKNTNRISRAHLECAATGEGHEFLHGLLCTFEPKCLDQLARVGHTSGLDAAAGALRALDLLMLPERETEVQR
jgi:Protein of unknown function (DUF2877)